MEVAHVFKPREGVEFVPRERARVLDRATDFQAPVGQRNLGTDAEVEHWKSRREMLTGREPVFGTDGRFGFPGHLAGKALLALDKAGVRTAHARQF